MQYNYKVSASLEDELSMWMDLGVSFGKQFIQSIKWITKADFRNIPRGEGDWSRLQPFSKES